MNVSKNDTNTGTIESRLKAAVDHSVPDVFDRILVGCEQEATAAERSGATAATGTVHANGASDATGATVINGATTANDTVIIPMDAVKKKRRRPLWQFATAAAAVLVLVAGGVFAWTQHNAYHTVASIVSLDVNPSIELKANDSDTILEAKALNDDAVTILDGMDLRDVDIDIAVNALIGSMVKNGYIDDAKNSILVSVENADTAKGDTLQKRITDTINTFLGTESITGAILSRSVSDDDVLRQLAQDYRISTAKAALIQAIIAKTPLLKFEDLAKLSINELNLLAESKEAYSTDMASMGTASDKAYIGEEKAKQIAFDHVGKAPDDTLSVHVEMDVENGTMVYDVEYWSEGTKHELEINAVSGEVLQVETETGYSGIAGSPVPTPDNPGSNGSGNGNGYGNGYPYDDDWDDRYDDDRDDRYDDDWDDRYDDDDWDDDWDDRYDD